MTTPVDMDDSDADDSADTRPIKTTIAGMIIEGLTTNKGRINAGY